MFSHEKTGIDEISTSSSGHERMKRGKQFVKANQWPVEGRPGAALAGREESELRWGHGAVEENSRLLDHWKLWYCS